MDTVYLIYDGKETRIPASEKDFQLYKLFGGTGGGIWNSESKEFVFNRKIDADRLSLLLPDMPIVKVS